MAATLTKESDNLYILRVTGTLSQGEFASLQKDLAQKISAGTKPRVLAILEEFTGWQKHADWEDMDFMLEHGDHVAAIAIVAHPKWKSEALVFAGAGFRKTPVQFFPAGEEQEARAWLTQPGA